MKKRFDDLKPQGIPVPSKSIRTCFNPAYLIRLKSEDETFLEVWDILIKSLIFRKGFVCIKEWFGGDWKPYYNKYKIIIEAHKEKDILVRFLGLCENGETHRFLAKETVLEFFFHNYMFSFKAPVSTTPNLACIRLKMDQDVEHAEYFNLRGCVGHEVILTKEDAYGLIQKEVEDFEKKWPGVTRLNITQVGNSMDAFELLRNYSELYELFGDDFVYLIRDHIDCIMKICDFAKRIKLE